MDLRSPDLGRNQKTISLSLHIRMLFAKEGYAYCHNEYADDQVMRFFSNSPSKDNQILDRF